MLGNSLVILIILHNPIILLLLFHRCVKINWILNNRNRAPSRIVDNWAEIMLLRHWRKSLIMDYCARPFSSGIIVNRISSLRKWFESEFSSFSWFCKSCTISFELSKLTCVWPVEFLSCMLFVLHKTVLSFFSWLLFLQGIFLFIIVNIFVSDIRHFILFSNLHCSFNGFWLLFWKIVFWFD